MYRLILIAEKDVVYDRFPTPLINRLEKHIVDTSTVLNERQKKVLNKLKKWIEKFNCLENPHRCAWCMSSCYKDAWHYCVINYCVINYNEGMAFLFA